MNERDVCGAVSQPSLFVRGGKPNHSSYSNVDGKPLEQGPSRFALPPVPQFVLSNYRPPSPDALYNQSLVQGHDHRGWLGEPGTSGSPNTLFGSPRFRRKHYPYGAGPPRLAQAPSYVSLPIAGPCAQILVATPLAWWTSSTGYEADIESPPDVGDHLWLFG